MHQSIVADLYLEDISNTNMGCDNFSLTPSESIYVYHNSVLAVNDIETTTK